MNGPWLNIVQYNRTACQSDWWNVWTIGYANETTLTDGCACQPQWCHQWCGVLIQTSRYHAIRIHNESTELTSFGRCIGKDYTSRVTRTKWTCINTHIYKTILILFVRGYAIHCLHLAPTKCHHNTFWNRYFCLCTNTPVFHHLVANSVMVFSIHSAYYSGCWGCSNCSFLKY